MELTLDVSPGDAARLVRLPAFKPLRAGRSRGLAARIVWHDTLDRALAAEGLALAEERGAWRLERHRPAPTEPWPPATDHRVIDEAAAADAFVPALPEAITPVAAFDGRRTVFPLTVDGESVSLTILSGVLRAVAAERPIARVIIDGPAQAARAVMLSLADAIPLSVPGQSLATEALHLADGTEPTARRRGAPVLPAGGLSVEAAFAHIIGHLTDVLLSTAPFADDAEAGFDAVHQMRVAVRRARSALSLFPPPPDGTSVAEGLKHLGHMLGPARDWDVFMTETAPPIEAALANQAGLETLLRTGGRRRRTARAALVEYLAGNEFRRLTLELAWLAAAPPPAEANPASLPDYAAAVLHARWKKLTNAGRSLEELDGPALHGLRLKAKRLRYAAEFFAPMFPEKAAARFIRRLSALQERLGEFNDTVAADTLLHELNAKPGYAAGLVLGFTAARGARSRAKVAAAWARFRRREPFWASF